MYIRLNHRQREPLVLDDCTEVAFGWGLGTKGGEGGLLCVSNILALESGCGYKNWSLCENSSIMLMILHFNGYVCICIVLQLEIYLKRNKVVELARVNCQHRNSKQKEEKRGTFGGGVRGPNWTCHTEEKFQNRMWTDPWGAWGDVMILEIQRLHFEYFWTKK